MTLDKIHVERSTAASRAFALVAAALLLILASLPLWGDAGTLRLVGEMAYYLALAQLWNLLVGYAGIVSIGQQAFVGIGGYALFYLTSVLNLNVFVALALSLPITAIIAAPVSLAVFRLRGPYVAIGTWVIAEVFSLLAGLIPALGGGSGLSLTPSILREVSADRETRAALLYLATLALSTGVFGFIYWLLRSRYGLALTALRDSERASGSLGVDIFRTKFLVYLLTAGCTGLIGALIFLQKLRISPESGFSINDWTVVVIFMVVIGGIGTLEGPFIGLAVYFTLRELLADYGATYLMALGAIAIVVMLKAPAGLWGLAVERFDLHLFPVGRRLAAPPRHEAQHRAALPKKRFF